MLSSANLSVNWPATHAKRLGEYVDPKQFAASDVTHKLSQS
jgi:hypothetical protein